MSRIGKLPVQLPGGVEAQLAQGVVRVEGPKGSLEMPVRPEIDVVIEAGSITVSPNGTGAPREARAYHGMTRALLRNMVRGVSVGFEKKLEIVGIGWNAQAQGRKLVLNIGYCHPVEIPMPQGVDVQTPSPTTVVVTGTDKQAVGQMAAEIRGKRPPEPYKGKGIRYEGEFVRRKAGKTFGS